MAFLLSERDEGARGVACAELAGQVSQVLIEESQFFDLLGQLQALAGERSAQVLRYPIAAPVGTNAGELGSLYERQVELAKAPQEPQTVSLRLRILAIAVLGPSRRGQESAAFVETERVWRGTKLPGERADSHEGNGKP